MFIIIACYTAGMYQEICYCDVGARQSKYRACVSEQTRNHRRQWPATTTTPFMSLSDYRDSPNYAHCHIMFYMGACSRVRVRHVQHLKRVLLIVINIFSSNFVNCLLNELLWRNYGTDNFRMTSLHKNSRLNCALITSIVCNMNV